MTYATESDIEAASPVHAAYTQLLLKLQSAYELIGGHEEELARVKAENERLREVMLKARNIIATDEYGECHDEVLSILRGIK